MSFLEYTTNLTAWWKASSALGSVHGDDVLSIASQAPGAYTLTGLAGATGKYQENQLNGYPALLFDGNNDLMTSSVNWSVLLGASGSGYVFSVVKPLAAPAPGATASMIHGGAAANPYVELQTTAGGVQSIRAVNNDGSYQIITFTPGAGDPPLLSWRVICWRHSGSALFMYLDNAFVPVPPSTGLASGASASLANPLTIASGAGARFCNMLWAETLIYSGSSMTRKNIGQVYAYLCAKYFSPNAVDSDHRSPLMRPDGNEQVRNRLTRRVLSRERRDRRVTWTGGVALKNYQIGDTAYLSHPRGPDPWGLATPPTPGWPDTVAGRQPYRVVDVAQSGASTVTLILEPLA